MREGVDNTKSYTYTPPIELRIFVQALLSEEVRGNKVEAEKKTGVRRQIFYWHFKKSAEFRAWYTEQCTNYLASLEALVTSKLIGKIQVGNLDAIKVFYELIGKLKKSGVVVKQSVSVGANGTFNGEDRALQRRIRQELFADLPQE
jgi:hypothetical protein